MGVCGQIGVGFYIIGLRKMRKAYPVKRVGLYYWAGPGTERMIKLKYPGARVDRGSHRRAYDKKVLEDLKDKLGLTDVWVSYSWGFADEVEREDREFLRKRLDNFGELGLRTHVYVQGTNLVERNQEEDYWCRDYRGRLVPYHRGRLMACPNNPKFNALIKKRVERALGERVNGVFVDNVLMGLLPLTIANSYVSFFGCWCKYCQAKFKKEMGSGKLPRVFRKGSRILEEYKKFRVRSLVDLVGELSRTVRGEGFEFGTNSFDVKHESQLTYGTDLEKLVKLQDYLLFENHDLPRPLRNNVSIGKLGEKYSETPIFVVSYKRGIGREAQFRQGEFDAIYTESEELGYRPCYKGSEYVTGGMWHCLRGEELEKVKLTEGLDLEEVEREFLRLPGALARGVYNRAYVPMLRAYFENRLVRKAFDWAYYRAIG